MTSGHKAIGVLAPQLSGVIVGKSIRLSDLAFVAVVCAFVAAGRVRRLPLQPAIAAVAGVVVAAVAIAALRAGGGDAVTEIARTLYSMTVLLVLAHLRLDDRERAHVLNAWIASAVVLAGLSLVAYVAVAGVGMPPNLFARGGSTNLGPSVIRASGAMPATTFAIYLTLALALFVPRVAAGSRRASRWSRVTLGLLLTTSALTLSRAFVGMPVMVAILARHRDSVPWLWARRRWATALALVVVAVVALTIVWPIGPTGIDASTNIYPLLHRTGVRMFVAQPLLGLGMGEFGRQWCGYTSTEERSPGGSLLRCGIHWSPHSVWIGAAAQGGVVLLGAWAALFVTILYALVRSRAVGVQLPRVAAAAVVGLILDGLSVEFAHVKFVWAFLGLALAAAATDATSDRAG